MTSCGSWRKHLLRLNRILSILHRRTFIDPVWTGQVYNIIAIVARVHTCIVSSSHPHPVGNLRYAVKPVDDFRTENFISRAHGERMGSTSCFQTVRSRFADVPFRHRSSCFVCLRSILPNRYKFDRKKYTSNVFHLTRRLEMMLLRKSKEGYFRIKPSDWTKKPSRLRCDSLERVCRHIANIIARQSRIPENQMLPQETGSIYFNFNFVGKSNNYIK